MSPLQHLLLVGALAGLWLIAERGYEGYEEETAFGSTPGGVATIEFVAMGGRIVLAAVVGSLVISAFAAHGWTTGVPAALIPSAGAAVYLLERSG